MKSEDWNTLLLIGFGCTIGLATGVLFLPELAPVPDGWASIVGAIIGVAGAFFAAYIMFHLQERAKSKSTLRPYVQRWQKSSEELSNSAYLISEITPYSKKLHEELRNLDNFKQYIKNLKELKNILNEEFTEDEKEEIEKKKNELRKLSQSMFEKIEQPILDNISKSIESSYKLISWTDDHKHPILSANQAIILESVRQRVSDIRENFNNIDNIFPEDRNRNVWEYPAPFLKDKHLLTDIPDLLIEMISQANGELKSLPAAY